MNKPQQPPDPPTEEGVSPDANPPNKGQNGIPDEAAEAEPTGLPTSDRHNTETTPAGSRSR